MLQRNQLPEGWGCFTRPTIVDGVTIAWRPLDWPAEDRGYTISVSRAGIMIGESYLNDIPSTIVDAAWASLHALRAGNEEAIMEQVSHVRERRGKHWSIVPL